METLNVENKRPSQMSDQPGLIDAWLEIGRRNPWISQASDPPFNRRSFAATASLEALAEVVSGPQSWCLGQAYYWQNLCLIQQVNGGDEWLMIKDTYAFESFSCQCMGRHEVIDHLERILAATQGQCISLDY